MEAGRSWRVHAWQRAKAEAAPKLSLTIVRMRMRRAAELGMSYRTYAAVHASSGRDVAGLIFTSNALGLHRGSALAPEIAARLGGLRDCLRIGLLAAPLDPVALSGVLPLDQLYRAPPPHAAWPVQRQAMARLQGRLSASALVLVGAAPGESDWVAAGRLGAYLPAERYFAPLA